ncbi:unnamed protein product [Schistosoma intercalatum]|nr:unnamed protein product [Schistosoma intercalatum]CAH8569407.1 unnamed protein product [Schistosoma intercalatum]
MMNTNKVCASCCEVVYPLELIRCFDQVWHRRCFRCQHCGMALSICNYHGGYDKKPYCAAHTPKPTSFTFIPDTPELLRVANNTRMFSSIRYSADAQRIRSKITSFPDDLWTQHTLRLSKQYSEANSVRSGRSSGFDERCSPQSYGRSASYYNSYTPPPTRFGLSNHCTSPHTFSNSSGINSRSLSNSGGCHLKIDPINHHHHYDQGHTPPANHNGLSRSGSCHSVIITPTGLPPGTNNNTAGGNVGSTETINIPRGSTVNLNFHGHTHQNSGFGGTFVAQYGYEAREDDEVTFKSGDIIVNGAPITEGWMYGTVQRTGKFGMLPSNYVKPYR